MTPLVLNFTAMKIWSVILLISMAISQFSDLGIVVDFMMRRTYYTQSFCVNSNVENSDCKASCFLKKKLEKSDDQKSAKNTFADYIPRTVVFFQEIFIFSIRPLILSTDVEYHYILSSYKGLLPDLFKPPS